MSELNLDGEPIFVDVSGLTATFSQDLLAGDEKKLKPDADDQSSAVKATNDKTSENRLKCTECKRFTCTSEEKMVRHMRLHRGENPFQCYMCEYSTYNKALFEEHVRIHKGIKPFKCSHCPYRSASKKNTKKHEQIHSLDNPRRCKLCNFVARHVKGLQNHMKKHNIVVASKVECKSCSETFENDELYQKHRKNHKRCKECKFVTSSQAKLKKHKVDSHGEGSEKPVKVKEDAFHCSLCAYSSSNKAKILLHLIHHPDQDVDEEVVNVNILREYGIMK